MLRGDWSGALEVFNTRFGALRSAAGIAALLVLSNRLGCGFLSVVPIFSLVRPDKARPEAVAGANPRVCRCEEEDPLVLMSESPRSRPGGVLTALEEGEVASLPFSAAANGRGKADSGSS
mmetsp:Transcript_128/g.461  ORF Transcript_128/g.461 Transcript_128/m.461 type:complete len:120 (+) Transcript_128:236-595(+)